MADQFEVLSIGEVNENLRIKIDVSGSRRDPNTDFYVRPPMTEDVNMELLGSLDPDSKLYELLISSAEKRDEWQRFTTDGQPSEEHVALGIELAEKIITLRGLRAGIVVAAIGKTLQSHLVLANEVSQPVIPEAVIA